MEKRRYDRIPVKNIAADISDGIGFFSANVSNISEVGMLIEDVPSRINHHAKNLSVVVSANGKNFKFLAHPRWVEKSRSTKILGLKIQDPERGWHIFVSKLKPENVDVWAASNLRA